MSTGWHEMPSGEEDALRRSLATLEPPSWVQVDPVQVLREGHRARRRHQWSLVAASAAPVALIAGGVWLATDLPGEGPGPLPAGTPEVCRTDWQQPAPIDLDRPGAAGVTVAGVPGQVAIAVQDCGADEPTVLMAGHTTDAQADTAVSSQMMTEASSQRALLGPAILQVEGTDLIAGAVQRDADDLAAYPGPATIVREPIPGSDLDAFVVSDVTSDDLAFLAWRAPGTGTLHTSWSQALPRSAYGVNEDWTAARAWVTLDRAGQWWVLSENVEGPYPNEPWATVVPDPDNPDGSLLVALLPHDASQVNVEQDGDTGPELLEPDEASGSATSQHAAHVYRLEDQPQDGVPVTWRDQTGEQHSITATPED